MKIVYRVIFVFCLSVIVVRGLAQSHGFAFSNTEQAWLIGDSLYKANDLPGAARHYKLLLDEAQIVHSDSVTAVCFEKLGVVHFDLLVLDEATEYLRSAENIFLKLNDYKGLCRTYITIGKIHTVMNDLPKAREYFIKAKECAVASGNRCLLAQALHRVSLGEFNMGNIDEAIKLINETIGLYKECNDLEGLSAAYNNLATYHFVLNDFASARAFLAVSLNYKFRINCLLGIALTYDNIGEIFLATHQLDSAEIYFNKSLDYCKRFNNSQMAMVNVYNHLAQVNEQLNNTAKSLEYYKLYHLYNDSILHHQNHARIQVLQVSQELDQKENELKVLAQKAKNQRLVMLASIVFFIFLLLISVLVYRQYRIKREANRQLSRQRNEILEKNQILAEQTRKLGELDELKTRFFANISHEFRTPLTLIKGPAEQLAEELKETRQLAASNLIVRNANRLQELINQLLDISRLERGSMKMQVQYSDINVFAAARISLFTSLAHEKNIQYTWSIPAEQTYLYFDADKLEKIMYNLLSNAFKYTGEGGSIAVVMDTDNNHNNLLFSVTDTGVGIPAGHIPYIFDRFFQSGFSNQAPNSSGIGLALVKELTDLYQGTITVKSEEGKGSIFTVQLPCAKEAFSEDELWTGRLNEDVDIRQVITIPETSQAETPQTESGHLLLVVEDNADMRQYIVSSLCNHFRIVEAGNGAEGLELALNENPDLVISDVMMPEMDGYQLTAAIKQNAQTCHIPVILLTAKAAEESMLKGFASEADDYLTKPFSVKELTARSLNLIKIREKLKEKFSKSIVVNPSEITTTSLDEQFLATALKVVEQNIDNPEFTAEMFCTETGVSRANMHRKLKALTNQSATEFIRSIRLKRAAQLLKQNSGNVSEIAAMVGFNTLSYFTSCFKEEFNCLPSEYSHEQVL